MKKCFLSFILLSMAVFASADLTEDFNTLTSGSWTTETDVTLPSGVWKFGGGAQRNSSNSVISIKMNASGAYMITPAVDSIQSLNFTYRSGGSNKLVQVAYSTDGTNWIVVDTLKIASASSSFASYARKLNLDSTLNVRVRLMGLSTSIFIDDVKLVQPKTGGTGGGGTVVIPEPDVDFTRPTFTASHATYYISPAGNDQTGDGSLENPWYNLGKAVSVAQAGDVIFCRGGRYLMSWRGTDQKLTVRLTQSGTATAPIVISAYQQEQPIFDFEQQLLDCNRNKSNVGDRGMLITGDYWILWGLHLTHAADNAIKLEGSHNRIERCEFSYNLDTGIQLGFGHNFSASGYGSSNDGSHCAYNDIIDCDSHHNCDFDMNYGSDADGFACKMHNGIGNRFIRCRSWRNADDAWDLYETDYDVLLYECWAWESGNAEDHLWPKQYLDGSASFSGNGNGIKLGGNGTGGSSQGIHYAYNCVAFGCDKSGSVKGFDCNSHKGGHVIVNCLAFDNGYDYMFESGGSVPNTHFYNNVCFGRQEISVGNDSCNAVLNPPTKLGWTKGLTRNFSRADYVSLAEDDAMAPRRGDGSMPTAFACLMPGSNLIDAGFTPPASETPNLAVLFQDFTFLQQPIYGAARDLGPYEYHAPDEQPSTALQGITTNRQEGALSLRQSREGETIAVLSVPATADAVIRLYNMQGQLVKTQALGQLTSGMDYYLPVATEGLAAGMYICQLQCGNYKAAQRMMR